MSDWSSLESTDSRPPLTRSADPKIAGVAGGFSELVHIHPNIIRILFVTLALAGGAGFLAYLGLWLLLPPSGSGAGKSRPPQVLAAGGALLVVALIVGLMSLGGVDDPTSFIVLAMLFGGITILNREPDGWVSQSSSAGSATLDQDLFADDLFQDDPFGASIEGASFDGGSFAVTNLDFPAPPDPELVIPGPAPAPGASPAPPPVADQPDASWPPPAATESEPVPSRESARVPAQPIPTMDQIQRTHWAVAKMADETTVTAPPKPVLPPGPPLGLITLAALAAVLGVALVLNTLANIFVGAATVVGIGTAIVGLTMAIGSFRGRTLSLVPIAVLLLILLPASPIIDHGIRDGIGGSTITVQSVDELLPEYRVGIGELILDLSLLEITEDTIVEASVGTGSLEVIVPNGIPVVAHGKTNVGELRILGEGRGGIGNNLRVSPGSSFDEDAPRLILEVSTTIGAAEVYRARTFEDGPEVPPIVELQELEQRLERQELERRLQELEPPAAVNIDELEGSDE
ncbi:MAG: PspC domain-containing protein [Acidimicrobiales bacterium]